MSQPTGVERLRGNRGVHVGLAVILGAAAAGFLVGIGGKPAPRERGRATADAPAGAAPRAVAYSEMGEAGPRPNRDFVASLPRELADRAAPAPPAAREAEAARLESLAARARRRAFSGAPPVVPHPVEDRSAASCLACHADAMDLGDLKVAGMPHETLAACTQCHVSVPAERAGVPAAVLAPNTFEGLPAPGAGDRAWEGAPPVVPHSTLRRETCLACHGPSGRPGLRTSHPERRMCLQCHGPSAELDQRAAR